MDTKQRQFIKDNYKHLSSAEISAQLHVKERKVEKYIQSFKKSASQTSLNIYTSLFPSKALTLIVILVVFCVGTLVYSNTLQAEFQFDDYHYIVNNPTVTDLSNFQKFTQLRKTSIPLRYFAHLSFALNYHFSQFDVFGYHLTNLFIHLTNAFLVFWLAFLICSTPKLADSTFSNSKKWIAFWAGLIFLTHPIQTQAVTYITQRFASLTALFYLASCCFYLSARLKKRSLFYGLSALFAVMAMFTKEIAFTLPFAILLIEFCFLRQEGEKFKINWLMAAPAALIGLIIPFMHRDKIISIFTVEIPSHSHFGDSLTFATYFLTQMRVLVTYLKLLVFPVGQNLDHDFIASKHLFDGTTFLCLLLLLGVIAGSIAFYKKKPILTFCCLWFFLAASIESSVILLYHVIFEHRVYLPFVGFAILLAALMYSFDHLKKAAPMVLGCIVVILCIFTYQRNSVWKTEVSLWSDVVKKSPNKYRGYYTLGMAYGKKGETDTMIDWFQKGLQANPENPKAYNNLGIAYSKTDMKKAIEYFEETIHVDPQFFEAYTNLGAMYVREGQTEKAVNAFQKAIEIRPQYAVGYNNLGTIFMRQGRFKEAESHLTKAVELDRNYQDAINNLRTLKKAMVTAQ